MKRISTPEKYQIPQQGNYASTEQPHWHQRNYTKLAMLTKYPPTKKTIVCQNTGFKRTKTMSKPGMLTEARKLFDKKPTSAPINNLLDFFKLPPSTYLVPYKSARKQLPTQRKNLSDIQANTITKQSKPRDPWIVLVKRRNQNL